jgi:hypothetical protein
MNAELTEEEKQILAEHWAKKAKQAEDALKEAQLKAASYGTITYEPNPGIITRENVIRQRPINLRGLIKGLVKENDEVLSTTIIYDELKEKIGEGISRSQAISQISSNLTQIHKNFEPPLLKVKLLDEDNNTLAGFFYAKSHYFYNDLLLPQYIARLAGRGYKNLSGAVEIIK